MHRESAPPDPVQRRDELALCSGAGRIAVVADTHSVPHPRLHELLREARPAAILHAGDIGDAGVLRALSAIAPTLAVRGNIDGSANELPDERVVAVREATLNRVVLRVFLTHIALRGSTLLAPVAARAQAAGASLVVCGHSHLPFAGRDRGLAVFNPGSAGPRRFTLPIVFGLIELQPSGVALGHVDCATGLPWRP